MIKIAKINIIKASDAIYIYSEAIYRDEMRKIALIGRIEYNEAYKRHNFIPKWFIKFDGNELLQIAKYMQKIDKKQK